MVHARVWQAVVYVIALLIIGGCGTTQSTTPSDTARKPNAHVVQGARSDLRNNRNRLETKGYKPAPFYHQAPVAAALQIPMTHQGIVYAYFFPTVRSATLHFRLSRKIARETPDVLAVAGIGRRFYWVATNEGRPISAARRAEFHRIVAIAEDRSTAN